MTPEDQEELFGDIAQKKGYISWSQLREALELQIEENSKKGEVRFIGEILYDLNFITKLELKDVLESIDPRGAGGKGMNWASYDYETASGCLVCIIGFILFFFWPIGTISGIAVMFIGK